MADTSVARSTQDKIVEYEKRVTERLQPDLHRAMEARKVLMQERQDYIDLGSNVQRMLAEKGEKGVVEPIHTRVPLGSDVEANAIIEDTETMLIKTQLGFWAECSLQEAPQFIKVHTDDLDRRIKALDSRVASIRMHVKLTLQALGELNQLPVMPPTDARDN
eukprot:jgi/Ulvmu1/11698/UM008_0109.1